MSYPLICLQCTQTATQTYSTQFLSVKYQLTLPILSSTALIGETKAIN